jgi:hypothetical protein
MTTTHAVQHHGQCWYGHLMSPHGVREIQNSSRRQALYSAVAGATRETGIHVCAGAPAQLLPIEVSGELPQELCGRVGPALWVRLRVCLDRSGDIQVFNKGRGPRRPHSEKQRSWTDTIHACWGTHPPILKYASCITEGLYARVSREREV